MENKRQTVQAAATGKLRIDSLMFLSLVEQKQVTNGVSTHDLTGPVLDRGYLNLRYRFNRKWRLRLTSNITADPNLPGQKAHAYLKYAFLVDTISPALQLVAGLQHTPWIHYEQTLDGHRYITRCFINSNDLDHSSDAGLGVRGRMLNGSLGYWLTETAGGGYKDLKHTHTPDFDGRIGLHPAGPSPANGWTLDLQYRNGFLGKNIPGTLNPSRHILYQTMATYTYDNTVRVAAGYVAQRQNHYKALADNTLNTFAYYFWGWDKLAHHISGYCRYEFRQQDATFAAVTEKKFRYVLALDYSPSKHLTLALAWDHTAYDDMGLVPYAAQQNNSYGLYSRIRF